MATKPLDPKIAVFGELLKDTFPGHEVDDQTSESTSSHFYRVDHHGKIAHRIYVSREFLSEHSGDEIQRLFRDWSVADRIREAGPRTVRVTNAGVTFVGQ